MKNLYIALALFLFSLSLAQDCEAGFNSINDECYFGLDIDVLEMFIYNSEGSINLILDDNNNGVIEPLELCDQIWENGRIVEFDCYPIIIGNDFNWIDISGEIPYNITNWSNIERLIIPYSDLSGFVPDDICELDLDFSDEAIFDLKSNQLCPPYPECIEDYMDIQSNWGTGSCELSNCYDFGVSEVAMLESDGDNILNPIQDPYGLASILVNVYNDGPYCSGYPGLRITHNAPGVTFLYPGNGTNEEFVWLWYGIHPDGTYFSEIPYEVSPFIPIGTEITFTVEAVTMNCYEESCSSDPNCHDCPLTSPVVISVVVGETFPNMFGDANIDGDLNVLDVVSVVEYILSQDEFDYDSSQLFFRMVDFDQNYLINVLDIIQIVGLILNA